MLSFKKSALQVYGKACQNKLSQFFETVTRKYLPPASRMFEAYKN